LFVWSFLSFIVQADNWVVIVAGSNGYQNYRHQSDACHAYHVVRKNGVPSSNIILMMYDDIANNEGNPFPGKLFNTVDGEDVYKGCVIDYKGPAVSMENFFKVLQGNKTAPGRVLSSTRDDDVFVFYTDHGAPGYVTFPSGPAMHADLLNGALVQMELLGMYKQLLFYMDACNSGSMFGANLKAPRLLAVTAADSSEESFAAYCPPYDKVKAENNRETFSCLGDIFSINWMLDAASSNLALETIGQQIDKVANLTLHMHTPPSHVVQSGDASIRNETTGQFEANHTSYQLKGQHFPSVRSPNQVRGVVNQRDVPLLLAEYRLQLARQGPKSHWPHTVEKLEAEVNRIRESRRRADQVYDAIAQEMSVTMGSSKSDLLGRPVDIVRNPVCYRKALSASQAVCGPMDDYSMKYSLLFANICNQLQPADFEQLEAAVQLVCKNFGI